MRATIHGELPTQSCLSCPTPSNCVLDRTELAMAAQYLSHRRSTQYNGRHYFKNGRRGSVRICGVEHEEDCACCSRSCGSFSHLYHVGFGLRWMRPLWSPRLLRPLPSGWSVGLRLPPLVPLRLVIEAVDPLVSLQVARATITRPRACGGAWWRSRPIHYAARALAERLGIASLGKPPGPATCSRRAAGFLDRST